MPPLRRRVFRTLTCSRQKPGVLPGNLNPVGTLSVKRSADGQPNLEATYAVMIGENAPARLPNVFHQSGHGTGILRPRLMQAAQNVTEAKHEILKAKAYHGMLFAVFWASVSTHS